jgi:RNA polymerase sigma-70 factor (ECF subfamily)
LSTEYGTLLSDRYLDGIDVAELAEMHRCTESALRSKLARARRAFREAFAHVERGDRPALTREAGQTGLTVLGLLALLL